MTVHLVARCLLVASLQHGVPVGALLAIMEVEGGRAGMESRNTNGTHDLGLMQINTCWMETLSKAWGVSTDEARARVRDNDCTNIQVAAWILKRKIREGNGNLLEGIARYNSANPRYGRPYLLRVCKAWRKAARGRSSGSIRNQQQTSPWARNKSGGQK